MVVAPTAATVASTASVFFIRVPPFALTYQRKPDVMVASEPLIKFETRGNQKKRAAQSDRSSLINGGRLTGRDAANRRSRDMCHLPHPRSDSAARNRMRRRRRPRDLRPAPPDRT